MPLVAAVSQPEARASRSASLTEMGTASVAASRWLNVVSHLDPRYGGLSAVVPQLGSVVARSGAFAIGLAAFCAPNELYAPREQDTLDLSYWPTSRTQWLRDPALRDRFRSEIARADGVHIHGLWEQSTAIAGHMARALRKPYILSAHGMLEPWALSNRRLKKWLYSALFERANVAGATCLHALTAAEAADYRRFGAQGPVAVIPNGVHIPATPGAEIFLSHFPALRGKRIVLFLGRIHYKKGLDLLIESWKAVAPEHPEAHLVIAGPDFEGTRAPLEARVAELTLTSSVTFPGMLRSELKWSALAAAEAFVLPSYSEGLSVSVLEAMGTGLPVIVTEQCNLPEVAQLGAGWLIQSNAAALTSSLQEMLTNSPESNRARGKRGLGFVADRYTWTTVGNQMAELYRWVQGGPLPTTVDLRMGSKKQP